jgi:hypothetical protein
MDDDVAVREDAIWEFHSNADAGRKRTIIDAYDVTQPKDQTIRASWVRKATT